MRGAARRLIVTLDGTAKEEVHIALDAMNVELTNINPSQHT